MIEDMYFALKRIFAYTTLFACLLVGAFTYQILNPKMSDISLDLAAFSVLDAEAPKASEMAEIDVPEMAFNEIKFPAPVVVKLKPVIVKAAPVKATVKPVVVSKHELPFHEPVTLKRVYFEGRFVEVAKLYQDFPVSEMIADAGVKDEVVTKQAASEKVAAINEENLSEPEFFEYEDSSAPEEKTAPVPVVAVELEETVKDLAPEIEVKKSPAQVSALEDTQATAIGEEVKINDVIAFNYGAAAQDVSTQKIPTVSQVQKPQSPPTAIPQPSVTTQKAQPETSTEAYTAPDNKTLKNSQTYSSYVTIQASEMDLKSTKKLHDYEVRYQDDLGSSVSDFGAGEVSLEHELASDKTTRSISLLKHGFAPTNTDLILEESNPDVAIPMMTEELFNQISEGYESRGPIGALLVELDDETELAQIDQPFGNVIKLDGDLKQTSAEDYRYQLYVGVKAGNVLLTYQRMDGQKVHKITHVHERELTFEANYFEPEKSATIKLLQEDLLSKESSPLIIGASHVKMFASERTSKKLNDHSYRMNFGKILKGSRTYLELNHQDEPIFLGLRDKTEAKIPSESFMRYILSNFDGALGNRCLVQVNLSKRVTKVDVGSESVGSGLMTFTQMLDADGKFYDSVGEKTRKVIIVGENQAAPELGQDAKINVRVEYLDGSNDYFSSYCSPNTYLVEQL